MSRRSGLALGLALAWAAPLPAQDHLVPMGPGKGGGGGYSAPAGTMDAAARGRLFARARMHHNKAGMARRKGDVAGAIAELRKILALEFPDDQDSWKLQASVSLNLADLLRSQGKLDDAEKAASKGLGFLGAPGMPATHYEAELLELQADVLDLLGRPKEAEAARQRYFQVWERLDQQGSQRD